MSRTFRFLVMLHCSLLVGRISAADDEPAAVTTQGASAMISHVDFAKDIRPLLSDRCFACHGPDEEHREADLRLDQLASLLEDRGDYQVVVPGDPSASELVNRIFSSDEFEVMPPPKHGKPLSADEKEQLRQWIAAGAIWKQHWAYERPLAVKTPAITDKTQRGANWIDAFVSQGHQSIDGHFAAPADAITLIRRLSFDLTGLPPDPPTVRRLLEDPRQDALERYIDRLLTSPAFGERLASYWLDLVRYADTVGYHGDQDHNISPYRDYVINALNDNRPFDAFTIDQLAGDLVEGATEEQIVATGYNRLLQTTHEGGLQPKEYLAIYQADRVRNLSATWMGATVGCAQCHDHKYDPYTAHDFYALAAFFADVDEEQHFKVGTNDLPTKRPPERRVLSRGQQLLLARCEKDLAELEERIPGPAEDDSLPPADSAAVLDSTDSCLVESDPLKSSAASSEGKTTYEEQKASLEQQIKAIRDSARETMITVSITPRDVRFLPRGNWLDDSGDVLEPAVPTFLGSLRDEQRATRLDLAYWLTNPDEGVGLLTARVFVNRLWMLLFGSGLSKSVEDFGGQGEAPTHPELLDQLALEFVRSGWDIKHMVRLITASRAYRQSSLETDWHRATDPQNRLLTRQNRFRVSAEMVRDTTLACSGLLVREIGGASVKPYQPAGYYRHLNFPVREYTASDDDGQWRRGLYVHWQRQFLHPMLQAFDAPTREECTAQRPESNTPLAALVWLNDPSFVEAAKALAWRILESDATTDIERIVQLFELTTSREPDAFEREAVLDLLAESRENFSQDPAASKQLLAVGLLRKKTQIPETELAAWMTVARATLNLNETYTRN